MKLKHLLMLFLSITVSLFSQESSDDEAVQDSIDAQIESYMELEGLFEEFFPPVTFAFDSTVAPIEKSDAEFFYDKELWTFTEEPEYTLGELEEGYIIEWYAYGKVELPGFDIGLCLQTVSNYEGLGIVEHIYLFIFDTGYNYRYGFQVYEARKDMPPEIQAEFNEEFDMKIINYSEISHYKFLPSGGLKEIR